jgi:hypothetical protein
MRAPALFLVLPALALAACVAKVSHPTKTQAEMQVDIDRCIDEAVAGRPASGLAIDPLGELEDTYDCLEKLGYSRGKATRDEVASRAAERPPRRQGEPRAPAEPCRVPCKR